MIRCTICWMPRRTAPSSPWCPSSTTATGAALVRTRRIQSTLSTPAVRSTGQSKPSLYLLVNPPKAHDMCYDTIDKSGLCDGLHPALVTYQFEPTLKGTLACTDCSGEELVNRRSVKEVDCHCKVIQF